MTEAVDRKAAEELRQRALLCVRRNELETALDLYDQALEVAGDEELRELITINKADVLSAMEQTTGEVQKLPAAGGFLTGAAAQFLLGGGNMRRDFTVSAVSCAEDSTKLELIPREPASYEKIFLDVDPKKGDVRGTRIVDLLGNQVVVEFREQRFNTSPAESEFRFEAPAGVKVIEISP